MKKCPDCNEEMQLKVWLPLNANEEGYGGYSIYQCPKCKNIEIDNH